MGGFETLVGLLGEGFDTLAGDGFAVGTWLLAGVFAWSGAAKLRRPHRAAVALADFGVARRPTRRAGATFAAAELALAVGLVTATVGGASAAPALLVAAGVLLAFTVAIGRVLRARRTVSCFCFGDAHRPVSRRTLARTAALAALAVALAIAAVTRQPDPPVDEALLAAVVAAGAVACVALLRDARRLLVWNAWRPRQIPR